MRILFVYTVEASLRTAVRGQIAHLVAAGHTVHAVTAPDEFAHKWVFDEGGVHHEIPMQRSAASVLSDVRALASLVGLIRRVRPDLVIAGSPKAGLLGMAAARLSRLPGTYVLHGLRLEGAQGLTRVLLGMVERVTCGLATEVVAVGHGLRLAAIDAGVVRPDRIRVIGDGSANGVSVARFTAVRKQDKGRTTFGYVGRVTADKGIEDLARAWEHLTEDGESQVRLLVVGNADSSSSEDLALMARLRSVGAELTGWLPDPAAAYTELDVLVLPSRREGLPTVVLEAAAAAIPTVMYDCTGARDAVVHQETGLIVPRGDVAGLSAAMTAMLDSDVREELGKAAFERTRTRFGSDQVWRAYADYYVKAASKKGRY